MAPRTLGKSYEPGTFENETYRLWEESGYFGAQDQNLPGQNAFCIMIPPPNVTGVLHMGHALSYMIEDSLVRWRRMKGDNTLWLPGTDHAGIATQAQVEKAIAKEGKGPTGKPLTRHDLGREAFLTRTWKWKEDHGRNITQQLKRLGASLDWKRERFTMDEGLSKAVREVFVKLYEEGLIYRGERIINWCPRCQTALSDLEVIPTDRKGFFWHLLYKVADDSGQPVEGQSLVVATTRPETLLGDTAVAVHPKDERYQHLHGKSVILPLLGRKIPIITDEYVDLEFGSGALKITPAHDFNDYEIGKRHALPLVSVMGKDGRMTAAGGPYAGLKFSEAREKVIQDLKIAGLLVKTEDHQNKIGLCQRCENTAEPVISKQWFVKVESLAKPAIEAVETGKIQFSPKNWEKTYFEWMKNIRDWCISRQLWWGHQIPAWYCNQCSEATVARETPSKCGHCSAPPTSLKQDEDVLDTWFSSALWPFSTLGWPEKTQALQTFYPTSILETGFDIIFFWVARMIMMGLHFMGEVPFRKVYLHAMVRDENGEKMSKSKGNVIDPIAVMDQYGSDPLRFTLLSMAGQGRDIKLSLDRVEGYRAFCNKLWNATKFFHLQYDAAQSQENFEAITDFGKITEWLTKNQSDLVLANQWVLSRFEKLCGTVESGLENLELNQSSQALYEFTWNEFCDWYIEFSKVGFRSPDMKVRQQTLYTLAFVLENLFRLSHPFLPFVTEELWQSLPWRHEGSKTLMLEAFPERGVTWKNLNSEVQFEQLKSIVEAIRNFRGENQVSPKIKFSVFYQAKSPIEERFVQTYLNEILGLAQIQEFVSQGPVPATSGFAVIPLVCPALELRIPMDGLVNYEEESRRLQKEIERVKADLAFIQSKLSKESFIQKAPAALVEKEKQRVRDLTAKLAELDLAFSRLIK